jgi:drug/metabolite transporter (DMT)-like permease
MMVQKNSLKGVLLVALGASSYGMLATFVKLAYNEAYTTAEVTVSQFVLGILGILVVLLFQRVKTNKNPLQATRKNKYQLMLAGTSLGMTSVFYYLAVRYIPVSIGIVMLMQTVWMAVILDIFLEKKMPSFRKVLAVSIVLIGTFLATNLFSQTFILDWRGVLWGLLAAASFTTTMFTSNRIAANLKASERSLWMLLGGAVVVFVFAVLTQKTAFNFTIFMKWGLVLALFGTIIPPMLLNAGFPHTGIGLGSIVASLELPVSVLMAYFILNEDVLMSQWSGIALIILAIVMMNIQFKKNKENKLI